MSSTYDIRREEQKAAVEYLHSMAALVEDPADRVLLNTVANNYGAFTAFLMKYCDKEA